MRVFVDSPVLVAALATRGICADLLRCVLVKQQLLLSKAVLRELRRLLMNRLALPRELADQAIPFLRERADICAEPQAMPIRSDAASAFDQIVAAAIEGRADVLVTGDQKLSAVDAPVSLQITGPRGFWTLIAGAPSRLRR